MTETGQVLINAATATSATKREFILTHRDFAGNSLPSLKASGLGSGDSVRIWEWIGTDWFMTDKVLDDGTTAKNSIAITSVGKYSVDLVMATVGPVTVVLNSAAR